ncbi:transmembrane protein [Cystoisospora suis]|uniref:Transmembrane protein n=1 Tax=Cystoisospora suis TaxID=483139 RepID=A0A2C6KYE9_9APIC|nr:transmembrane protein [Cystoisospora suis]
MRSVKTGVAHMTDIYFILAYQQGSSSHLTDFYRTCPVSGSPNNFLTLKEYNIESLQDLSRTLRMATSAEMRTIAYLSTGNYETIHFFFPSQTLGEVMTKEEAERRILSREILGNIRTGSGGAGMSPKLEVVDLGLILGQGPWLKRTDTTHCLYHQLIGRQLAKDQHQQNLSFLTKLQMEVDLQQDAKKAKARSSSSSSSSSAASSSIFAKQGGGALLFLFVSSLTMYMM